MSSRSFTSPLRRRRLSLAVMSLALILPFAGGCVTKGNFPSRGAEAWCDKLVQCHGESSLIIFGGSIERCNDYVEDLLGDIVDNCEDWDGKIARECIRETEDRACSTIKVEIGGTPCTDLLAVCR